MCNCIKEFTEQASKSIKTKHEGTAIIDDVKILQQSLMFNKGMSKTLGWQTFTDIGYHYTPIKKDKTPGKKINKSISLYHTYCPFCGVQYPKDTAE